MFDLCKLEIAVSNWFLRQVCIIPERVQARSFFIAFQQISCRAFFRYTVLKKESHYMIETSKLKGPPHFATNGLPQGLQKEAGDFCFNKFLQTAFSIHGLVLFKVF